MLNRIAKKIYNQYRLSIIAKKVFYAALTDQQKTLVDEYTNKRQQSLSFGPMFSSDRTYFNIGKSNLSTIQMPKQIQNVLDKQGYYCPDYRSGYVYKKEDKLKSKPVKLIKILKKGVCDVKQFDILKKSFDQRLGTSRKQMKSCLICITHNPYDVAGMSTDRNWTSCMNLDGGMYHQTALKQVQYGGMCAYLIQNNDKEVERPIARIAIKRFVGENGGFMFASQNVVYGDNDFANELNFINEINSILQESNEQTIGESKIFERKDDNSYSDSNVFFKNRFETDDQFIKYVENNFNNYIKNEKFMNSLEGYQLYKLFPLLIENIDDDYEVKRKCLERLIKQRFLTEKQKKITILNIFIIKQDVENLCNLITTDVKLTKKQKELILDIFIKKQYIKGLYNLILYDKLTKEQKDLVFNFIVQKIGTDEAAIFDVEYLYNLIDNNKLNLEQRKLAINKMLDEREYEFIFDLILFQKTTSEQNKLIFNFFIKKQVTKYLYKLIYYDLLNKKQFKLALNLLVKKKKIEYLKRLIQYEKLTEQQIEKFNIDNIILLQE